MEKKGTHSNSDMLEPHVVFMCHIINQIKKRFLSNILNSEVRTVCNATKFILLKRHKNIFNSLKVFVTYFKMSLTVFIRCHCYMFRPHMGHHKGTLIIWGDHCTVHFVLSTHSYIGFVVVIILLRRIFPSYLFSGRFSMILSLSYLCILRCWVFFLYLRVPF
jgi:hypothetical protein